MMMESCCAAGTPRAVISIMATGRPAIATDLSRKLSRFGTPEARERYSVSPRMRRGCAATGATPSRMALGQFIRARVVSLPMGHGHELADGGGVTQTEIEPLCADRRDDMTRFAH